MHWVSAQHAIKAEARLYENLFTEENPEGDPEIDFTAFINPNSLTVVDPIYVEPHLESAQAGERYQFERLAYFVVDEESTPEKLVFNRTVTLRDQWRKVQKQGGKAVKAKRKRRAPAN